MQASPWKERLSTALLKALGSRRAPALLEKYGEAFGGTYREECSSELAVKDIQVLEKLSAKNFLEIEFYYSTEGEEKNLHMRVYKWDKQTPLSDLIPIFDDFDFRVYSQHSYRLNLGKEVRWINDFVVTCKVSGEFSFDKIRPLLHQASLKFRTGHFESDGLNKLILRAELSWQEITILRAYTRYLRQVGFRFSQVYIEQALVNNADLARDLVHLFLMEFDPKQKTNNKKQMAEQEGKILQALEKVASLDEDMIIRRIFKLIQATLRTNYFQEQAEGEAKAYLSIKLNSAAIPELPLPVPLYEIFVYSPRFEGIHLRAAKVARGGIRWSDRREDFRYEVLGLMKAQKVKNAIIVPSGAKGGFVLKTLLPGMPREAVQQEVVTCYKLFICGLLDLTDNIKNGKILRPKQVVCHDDEDPYLVVAADKGTASFSDIANALSADYDFWLGDAFASGGKTGYDHKKMGITARGAWESIKRHFRQLDVNLDKSIIKVVGIGDMSGDVFGNGLLYSKRLQLVAVFDHRHIFLDPDPDPELSYQERLRLFKLPTSSWEDYNAKLISKGGGVYKRSVKSISLTPEVRKLFDITVESMMPNELIRAILKAPVDLLFNGGIGTYVKGSTESNADVSDKNNDLNRVNGNELRCRVVGEGGNLGFTQKARVEYALNKGLINTDFIDNSAGVDCSDHEVNLKILLNGEIAKGKLTEKKRNLLLTQVTQEIAALVLRDNFSQAWILGFLNQYSYGDTILYQTYLRELEEEGLINRQVEYLPDDKMIADRRNAGIGLTSPELAVLLAYTKINLKAEILKSDLPEDPFFAHYMEAAFPASINKLYYKAWQNHSLRREIIATQVSSQLVNEMGVAFVYRLQSETGVAVADIVRAQATASAVFNAKGMQNFIQSLDYKISAEAQYELLHHLRHLINISTRWFLQEGRLKGNFGKIIEHYATRVKQLEELILELMTGFTKDFLENLGRQFEKAGLTPNMARRVAVNRVVYITLNIIEVATQHNFDLVQSAKLYFAVGESFHLVWFRDFIANDRREGSWNALARLTLRDELDHLQKALTVEMMKTCKKETNLEKVISHWKSQYSPALNRWEKLLGTLRDSSSIDYSMFFIVLRELGNLLEKTP